MRIVAVASQKGGVGKSTTVLNLAAIASRTERVLVVDGDEQESASDWIQATDRELPFDFAADTNPDNLAQLRNEPYDLVLVDTPGSLSATKMLHTIAQTADFMVLPTSTEWLAVRAMVKGIAKVVTPNNVPYKVLLNRVDGGAPSEVDDARQLFTSKGIAVFNTAARNYKAIYRLPLQGRLITDLTETGSEAKAAMDWQQIATELFAQWSRPVDLRDTNERIANHG